MIVPTVGRVVWFHPADGDSLAYERGVPLAAIVARVWSDTCVNLGVIDANGVMQGRTSVFLFQGEGERPSNIGSFCEWMPYQQGQAAKTDDLSKSLASRVERIEEFLTPQAQLASRHKAMPAKSEAQRRYLNWKFGHAWAKKHGFDNRGKLPARVRKKKGKR